MGASSISSSTSGVRDVFPDPGQEKKIVGRILNADKNEGRVAERNRRCAKQDLKRKGAEVEPLAKRSGSEPCQRKDAGSQCPSG